MKILPAPLQNRPFRRAVVVGLHAALWVAAFSFALALQFGAPVPHARAIGNAALLLLVLRLASFQIAGLFDGLFRYAGFPELEKIVVATTLSSLAAFGVDLALPTVTAPVSVYLVEWLASIVFTGGARLAMRGAFERSRRVSGGLRTLIIGAGDAGESLVRDVQRSGRQRWTAVGFLDDDPLKHGALIRNIRVLGPADKASIEQHVRALGVELVVLAMPTATGARIREVVHACKELNVEVRTVPALADRVTGGKALREVHIDDLLRREPVQLDQEKIREMVRGRVVLVTGAGGSIGSELARHVQSFAPRKLLLLDHDENALFYIERELREQSGDDPVEPVIADITDETRIDQIFERYRPSVVLHAAAHKHVSMMEANPCEAVKNNIFGTVVLAEAAKRHRADAFVLISTDKAVRPSSVMGATKRVAEMLVERNAHGHTRFVAVRFGNVLGSAGSVVPIFCDQIARGGPVTVTHPEVSRYFMTISEAAQLVLQAATLGHSGNILVLDMGEPVRIVDLARDLIELSVSAAGDPVEIVFTGLKPGEKLTEELLVEGESYRRTGHAKIMVGQMPRIEPAVLDRSLDRMFRDAERGDDGSVRRGLANLIPDATLEVRDTSQPVQLRPPRVG